MFYILFKKKRFIKQLIVFLHTEDVVSLLSSAFKSSCAVEKSDGAVLSCPDVEEASRRLGSPILLAFNDKDRRCPKELALARRDLFHHLWISST